MYGKICFFSLNIPKKLQLSFLSFYVRMNVIDSCSVSLHPSSLKPEFLLIGGQDFQRGPWEMHILPMKTVTLMVLRDVEVLLLTLVS